MGKIEFISTVPGLEEIEEYQPKPAKHFIPEWFKDIPAFSKENIPTARHCPSFPDFFSQGYIIPMWGSTKLLYNGENWNWESSSSFYNWEVHGNQQFMDYVSPYFQDKEAKFIFKTECPWRVITPKGWSVLQLPLFYHFNQEWSVMPGIIDTDIHHEIHQQVLYHGDNNGIEIKAGAPFVLYIPFKRNNKLDIDIKAMSKKHQKIFIKQKLYIRSKFGPNGLYRKMQRDRDKNG